VTIATNMAGRGTDIKLEPEVLKLNETWSEDLDEPCGLHIVGTERHESRRIDRQLRGRAGRQGDPGAAVFFLSLEDDLMRLFATDRMIKVMDRLGVQEGEVITHNMVTKAVEKAQVRVENHNFEIRKHLIKYDDVVNKQRELIYARRREILMGEECSEVMQGNIQQATETLVATHADPESAPDYWNFDDLAREYQSLVLAPLPITEEERLTVGYDALQQRLEEHALERYHAKETRLTINLTRQLLRFVLLRTIDEHWRDHLNQLILLRSGIGLRSYGQRDPLVEYKAETFKMFEALLDAIERESVSLFFRAEIAAPAAPVAAPERVQAQHQEVSAYQHAAAPAGGSGQGTAVSPATGKPAVPDPGGARPARREVPKVGRNDPCPCGSGKKYKRCCGS
jgi:preprotein translocase subunit SecA